MPSFNEMDTANAGTTVVGQPQQPHAGVPNVRPMLSAMSELQNTHRLSPEASAFLTRMLYAPVMGHSEMQRWANVAYPQPPQPQQTPQQMASQAAQLALLFGQR